MKKVFAVTAALVLLSLGGIAQANITIDTVPVGNAGNAADTRVMNDDTTGYGSVGYNYNIGKYEVTAGQYTAFLSAVAATDTYGLYNASMSNTSTGSGITRSSDPGSYTYSVATAFIDRPVNYVSYWDSCRFANWLGNGQGSSGTETGAYTLTSDGITYNTITRNIGWTGWAVTNEDEWYKAAYYKGGGAYSLYANGTNTAPGAGTASNYNGAIGHTWDGTIDGAWEQNGTKDMMGNVWEWNEAIVYQDANYADRGLRGGSFSYDDISLQSSSRYYSLPNNEYNFFGFRVSQVPGAAVPEPSSIIALLGGLAGPIGLRRRKA